MRILFCNYEYPPLGGGGGVINAFLAEELARRHDVTVLTSQALGLPPESAINGVRVVRAPVFFRRDLSTANFASMLAYLLTGVRMGGRLLRAAAFDLINTHFALPTGPVGQALADRFHVPNVLSVHGGDLYDPSKWTSPHRHAVLRAWVGRLARRADAVVAQSANTLSNLNRFFAADVPGLIIPLGIPSPPRPPSQRSKWGIAENEFVLVSLGRLVRRKRLDQLISIVARLPDHICLFVIGNGPEESALRQQAASLGIAERVRFMGRLPDQGKFELLSSADVFVSTSQHEGFGLVFLEAMALGLPVVCYGHGGQTDFLVDGKTGYLLELDDVPGFEERCRWLARDRELRSAIGATNRQLAETFFIDKCAQQYEEIFDAVLSGEVARCLPVSSDPPVSN